VPKLTAKKVENLRQPGFHGDGEGLYLKVGKGGAKSWILRTVVHGRRRDLGLGAASLVSLAEARTKARAYRKIAREGGDPDTIRKRESLTFEEAARRVHAQLLPTWKNRKHAETWLATVENYAHPKFGKRPLHTIGTADILSVLSPIWTDKHETAKRLKQRLSTIFDWAKCAGQYPHENPVNGVKKALPTVKQRPEHLAAMMWQKLPTFMQDLREREGVSARTLEFLILTATRSGEARGTRWSELDLEVKEWLVPATRMKRGVPHRVPLSPAAVDVLHVQICNDQVEFVRHEIFERSIAIFSGLDLVPILGKNLGQQQAYGLLVIHYQNISHRESLTHHNYCNAMPSV